MVTKPIQPTLPFNPEEIKPSTAKKVVDGLGRSVRQFHYNAAENILEHEDDLVHVSSYDMKSKEPKIGSREHKFKNPEKYVSTYISSLEQAAFPIPGTAPSEVAAAKKIINEQYKDPTSISADEIKYLKPKDRGSEIKIDYKAPTYFPTN